MRDKKLSPLTIICVIIGIRWVIPVVGIGHLISCPELIGRQFDHLVSRFKQFRNRCILVFTTDGIKNYLVSAG